MTSTPEELPPLNILLNQLDWNLQWLQQMEKNEPTVYFRDAALQRFEFTFNVAVKCIQAGGLKSSAPCESPEECFVVAERMQWFAKDAPWKAILRNIEHMKTESGQKEADTIFANLKAYREHFKTLFDRLTVLDENS